jgi:hypothetical protein
MSRIEGRVDGLDESPWENTIKFVLTLIVTTVIVAAAVYVLGSAMFEPGASGPAHRAAIAAMHAHS